MSGSRFDSFQLAVVLSDLDRVQQVERADLAEFRMDLATHPLEQLTASDAELPLIATNRARWEGGEAPESGRIDALCEAVRNPTVVGVDIELESVEAGEADELRDQADAHDTAVIVSSHDFSATPPIEELESRLQRGASWGDVGKLAVTADTIDDVLDLLVATRAQARTGHQVATMSMGAVGRHSRVIAPLYGSCLGYAPLTDDEATAPGQYDVDTLADLLAAVW